MLQTDAPTPAGSPAAAPTESTQNTSLPGSDVSATGEGAAASSPPAMPDYRVRNWTDAYELEVSASRPHGRVPALVGVFARGGNMDLHHCMSAPQARQMAAQLMLCADAVDGLSLVPPDAARLAAGPSADPSRFVTDVVPLNEPDVLHVGVPYFEAISLEVIDLAGKMPSEYFEIPLHHVPAVMTAMQKAAAFASVDLPR